MAEEVDVLRKGFVLSEISVKVGKVPGGASAPGKSFCRQTKTLQRITSFQPHLSPHSPPHARTSKMEEGAVARSLVIIASTEFTESESQAICAVLINHFHMSTSSSNVKSMTRDDRVLAIPRNPSLCTARVVVPCRPIFFEAHSPRSPR